MFLPKVEAALPDGERGAALRALRDSGQPIPQIYHLFAFRPERSALLAAFTEGVMRGPSPLPPGQRELIAALTSRTNFCDY